MSRYGTAPLGNEAYVYFALVSVHYWPNLASIAHNEMHLITRFYGIILYSSCIYISRAHARVRSI